MINKCISHKIAIKSVRSEITCQKLKNFGSLVNLVAVVFLSYSSDKNATYH